MESRREKFKRLANIRVNNALKQLDLIGNLSNRSSYDYTEDEIRKIFQELDSSLRLNKVRFAGRKNKNFKI